MIFSNTPYQSFSAYYDDVDNDVEEFETDSYDSGEELLDPDEYESDFNEDDEDGEYESDFNEDDEDDDSDQDTYDDVDDASDSDGISESDGENGSESANASLENVEEIQSEVMIEESPLEHHYINSSGLPDNDSLLEGYIEEVAEDISGEEVDISTGDSSIETTSLSNVEVNQGLNREGSNYGFIERDSALYASDLVSAGRSGSRGLTSEEKNLYEKLQEKISKVASGEVHSTIFTIPISEIFDQETLEEISKGYTAQDLGLDTLGTIDSSAKVTLADGVIDAIWAKLPSYEVSPVVNTLLYNNAYELYWFDKTQGWESLKSTLYSYGYQTINNVVDTDSGITYIKMGSDSYIEVKFRVSQDYKGSSESGDNSGYYTTNEKTIVVNNAIIEAKDVVAKASSSSDKGKIDAYKEYICNSVEYNQYAIDNNTAYGDPWQVIYVFDKNTTTNVVCEGYSKAFKLLCDMTSFSSPRIECYIVSGYMGGGTGEGAHMWNIVTMNDGGNYLVDVTNCDGNTVGNPDYLYLAGYDVLGTYSDASVGYEIKCKNEILIDYKYYDGSESGRGNMGALYSKDILAIEDHDYGENLTDKSGTSIKNATVTFNQNNFLYDGTPKEPIVTVTVGNTILTPDTDYEVSYSDVHTNVGIYTATITGKGAYDGTRAKGYTIKKTSLQTITATLNGSNPASLAPRGTGEISVSRLYPDSSELTYSSSNTDIATVDPKGNVTAVSNGTATITVTSAATSNCNKATATIDLTVDGLSLSGAEITLSGGDEYTYTGSQITPEVKRVMLGDLTLNSSNDYEVTYGENINVSSGGSVTVTGKGQYSGSATKSFTIKKATPTLNAKVGSDDVTEVPLVKGQSKTLSIEGVPEEATLSFESKDTSVATVDANGSISGIEAGSTTITAKSSSTENYNEATVSVTVTVGLTTINESMVSLSTGSFVYNGKSQSPVVTVNDGAKILVQDTDYTVQLNADCKNVGQKSLTVIGKGGYTGAVNKTFEITQTDKQTVSASIGGNDSINLELGQTSEAIVATRSIEDVNASGFTYTSSNESVAKVDNNGKITAAGKGSATITVTSVYTTNCNEASAIISVTVSGKTIDISGDDVEITLKDDSNNDVNDSTYTYNGTGHQPKVSVTYGGNTLIEGAENDFSIGYSNNINAGTATVTVTGTNNANNDIAYTGSKSKSFTIQPKNISGGTLVLKENGDEVKNCMQTEVTLSLEDGANETTLTKDTEYTVEYSNNINASANDTPSASVTVIGNGNYAGTLTKSFYIKAKDQNLIVSPESGTVLVEKETSFTVDGAEGIVVASVEDERNDILSVNTSETKDNKATITVQGKSVGEAMITVSSAASNYNTATKTVNVTVQDSLADAEVVLGDYNHTYSGGKIQPPVTSVICHGKSLEENTHYTLAYGDNTNAGKGTITFTGKDGTYYIGEKTISFDIEKADKDISISSSSEKIDVDGTATVSVTDSLNRQISYSSSDEDIASVDGNGIVTGVNPGQVVITAEAASNDNYNKAEANATINVYGNLANAAIELEDGEFHYDGSEKKPEVTVKLNNKIIDKSCYDVSYSNNTSCGTATVTVTGKESKYYRNSKSTDFTITQGLQNLSIPASEVAIYVEGNDASHPSTASISVENIKGNVAISGDEFAQVGNVTLSDGTATATVTAKKPGVSRITVKVNDNDTGAIGEYDSNYATDTETIAISVRGIIINDMISLYEGNDQVADSTYIYDKKEKKPAVKVTYDSTQLIQGTDYSVAYENNVDAGTATVKVSGTGNYSGSEDIAVNFKINKAERNNFNISTDRSSIPVGETETIKRINDGEVGEITCTSSNESVATVSSDGIIKGISAGNATIFVTANETANYKASETKTLNINVTDNIKNATITLKEDASSQEELSDTTYRYDGSEKKPYVSVVHNGKDLTLDTDFTVEYSNNTNAGTATVKITGIASYEGSSVSKTFKINKASQTLTVTPDSYKVQRGDNSAVITPTSKDENNHEISDMSYSYSSENESIVTVDANGTLTGVGIGTAKVTVTAESDNYEKQSKDVTVKVQAPIEDADVTLEYDTTVYDGTDKKPSVTVKLGDYTGRPDTDYTVSYSRNEQGKDADDIKSVGIVTVTITGNANLGYFTGSTTKTFDITKTRQDLSATLGNGKLQKGATADISAVSKIEGTSDDISDKMSYSFESEDTGVATVSDSGTVTGIEIGKTKIKVTATSPDYESATVMVDVMVQVPVMAEFVTLSDYEYTYDGSEKKPNAVISYNGTEYSQSDGGYTASYSNNINAGRADDASNPPTVTVSCNGEGYFTGTASKTFTIVKKDLSITASLKETVVIEGGSTTVVVGGIKEDNKLSFESLNPEVATVDDAGKVSALTKGTAEIKVTAAESTNYGSSESTATLNVLGNLYGSGNTTITLSDGPFVYNNSEIQPQVTVSYHGTLLSDGTDYDVTYRNNVNAGTAGIIVTGKGEYAGYQETTFKIDPREVKVTADNKEKEYGTKDPDLTYTCEGLTDGDTQNGVFTGTLTRDTGRTPGEYAIRQGSLAANDNYFITFINGIFTIKAAKNASTTVSNVGGDDTSIDGVTVNGLDEYAKSLSADEGTSIEVEMIAKAEDETEVKESIVNALVGAIKEALSNILNGGLDLKREYLELSIVKHEYDSGTNTETETDVTELPSAIENEVKFDTSGKSNITVARSHEDTVEVFDKLNSKPTGTFTDATFFVGDNTLYIYSSGYSTFAIAYTVEKRGVDNSDKNNSSNTSDNNKNSGNSEENSQNSGGNSGNNTKNTDSGTGGNTTANNSAGSTGSSSTVGNSGNNRRSFLSGISNYIFGRNYASTDYSSDDDTEDDAKTKTAGKGASKAEYVIIGKKSVRYDNSLISDKATKAVIPDTVKIGKKTYGVTSVASDAFDGKKNVKVAVIGANVKKLEENAFAGAKKLKKLKIKSEKLTKAKVSGSLKNSSIKKLAVPVKKLELYKKIFAKDNSGKSVKIKGRK